MNKRIVSMMLAAGMLISLSGCNEMQPSLETVPEAQGTLTTQTPVVTIPTPVTTEAPSEMPEASTEAPTPAETVAPSVEAPTEPTQPAVTPNYEIAEGYTAVTQIVAPHSNLKMRQGPGTEYESIGLLVTGQQVTRISIGDAWSQIVYNGKVYFVASEYLDLIQDNATATETPSQEAPSASQAPSQNAVEEPSRAVLNYAGSSLADLAGLDNTSVPYGYGGDRDANNRPNGVLYYDKLYGKYGADFIGPNTNTIYLTMDEGYEAGFTPTILDTLKEKQVKAVFFLTKQFVTEHPELVQRMIAEGHVLGNHTCKHPAAGMPALTLQEQYDDVMWMQNHMKEKYGYEMHLFRYPSGVFSIQSMALMNSIGLHPVFWSFAHKDWVTTEQPDPASALQNCLNQLHPGAIYLLHAVSETNTVNMASFIDGARAAGYEFGVYPATGF